MTKIHHMRCAVWGSDADGVADLLDDFVSGMREGGLSVTLRTFPGIGNVCGCDGVDCGKYGQSDDDT